MSCVINFGMIFRYKWYAEECIRKSIALFEFDWSIFSEGNIHLNQSRSVQILEIRSEHNCSGHIRIDLLSIQLSVKELHFWKIFEQIYKIHLSN